VTARAGADDEPAVEAIAVGKRLGSLVALDNVSLRLQRVTTHALLGENGAGKSTLVKGIMGYYHLRFWRGRMK
jgi:ABC-type sugar transport system ATPase subunit